MYSPRLVSSGPKFLDISAFVLSRTRGVVTNVTKTSRVSTTRAENAHRGLACPAKSDVGSMPTKIIRLDDTHPTTRLQLQPGDLWGNST